MTLLSLQLIFAICSEISWTISVVNTRRHTLGTAGSDILPRSVTRGLVIRLTWSAEFVSLTFLFIAFRNKLNFSGYRIQIKCVKLMGLVFSFQLRYAS